MDNPALPAPGKRSQTQPESSETSLRRRRPPLPDSSAGFRKQRSRVVAFTLLTAGLIGAILLSILTDQAEVARFVSLSMTLKVIGCHLFGLAQPNGDIYRRMDSIVWEQRMPRAVCGALVGMLLAMAGVAFQSLLRNPLADPYMVGVSAGSALGSVLVGLATANLAGSAAGWALTMQPIGAFVAGIVTMIIVYSLSCRDGRLSTQNFLLAGIIVGTVVWSLIQLTLALAVRSHDPGRAEMILAQQLGSIQFVGWREVGLLVPFGLCGLVVLGASWRELNLMALGEESAAHLGVNTEGFKRRVIVAGSLATAASVSVAGIIAFVGMIVPHIARRVVGPDHRALLPAAMLLGGIVLVLSDWISRVFLNGLEIGVITSLIGGPVFCYLLRRRLSGT